MDEIATRLDRKTRNPAISQALLETFGSTFRRIADTPFIGRSHDEFRPGLRGFPARSYIVLYYVRLDHVEIARVLHQRRDLPKAFRRRGKRK